MPNYELFPQELRSIAHWCVYRLVPDPKNPQRLRKPPFQSKDPYKGCSSVDPSQWSTFEEAVQALENPANKLDGIGWFFTRPYFGIDLDHVRDENGTCEPWALEFMAKYPTYWELSPSRTGYHGIGHGRVPQVEDPKNPLLKKDGQVKKGRVEVYGGERYFTVTGFRLGDNALDSEVCAFSDQQVRELYAYAATADPLVTQKVASQPQTTSGGHSRLQRMNLLSLGRWQELHASQSEADLEYCCFLAEAAKGDRAKTEEMFRASKLFRSVEQGKHPGYVPSTVEQACHRYELDPNKDKRKDSQAPLAPLVVSRVDVFLQKEIPPREPLMCFANGTPIFEKQSLSQIFAWRGSGKTMIALAIAGGLAKGSSFLNWKATRPVKTLYVEGEMPQGQMQTRINSLVGTTENLFLITLDEQTNNHIPPLSKSEGQALVEAAAEACGAEFIVLDSISSLCGMATNEEDSWIGFLNWLMRLRSKGYGVLMLHHAGKGGLQRGHSRSEDPLDLSIKLDRPGDYEMTDGLRVLLTFDKTRGIVLPEGTLEVRLQEDQFVFSRQQQSLRDQIVEMAQKNPKWSTHRIAKELDASQSMVARHLREAGTRDPGGEQESFNPESF